VAMHASAFTGDKFPILIGLATSVDTSLRQAFYDTGLTTGANRAFLSGLPHTPMQVGTRAGGLPNNVVSQDNVGVKFQGFGTIFYNRIDVSPTRINFGNITANVSDTISVFNAFFTPQTMSSLVLSVTDGLNIVGPGVPLVLGPLESFTFTVNALIGEGPPSIDATALFSFTGLPSQSVEILGARILAFPYLFSPGTVETISWSTQVMTSNDGSEQRVRVRNAPRTRWNFAAAVPRSEINYIDSLFYGWRTNSFALPITSECRRLTSDVTIGDTLINFDTTNADHRVGSLLMLYKRPGEFEMIEISAVTGVSVTLIIGTTQAYTAAETLVMPVRVARLLSDPRRRTEGHTVRVDAAFEVTDNMVIPSSASPDQYKGLDVFLTVPLTDGQYVTDTYSNAVNAAQFDSTSVQTFSPWQKTKIRREFGTFNETQADLWEYKTWLNRRAGRLRPFWYPTFEHNFTLLNVGTVNLTLNVADDRQATLLSQRSDLAIETTTGFIYREILSVTAVGGIIELVVDSAISLDATLITGVFLMGRKRVDSDRIEIVHEGNNVSSSVLNILEINN